MLVVRPNHNRNLVLLWGGLRQTPFTKFDRQQAVIELSKRGTGTTELTEWVKNVKNSRTGAGRRRHIHVLQRTFHSSLLPFWTIFAVSASGLSVIAS